MTDSKKSFDVAFAYVQTSDFICVHKVQTPFGATAGAVETISCVGANLWWGPIVDTVK